MAGFFPLFFKSYFSDPSNPAQSTFYLGLANSGASLIVAGLAPFLGSIADRGASKKKFLAFFTGFGVLMCGGLWTVAKGDWQTAVLLYVLSTVGFMGANIFYDSLLPSVASKSKLDIVSSLGFSLGYVGGGILFALNVLMFLKPALFGIPDGATAIRISFLIVAVWWIVFSIPLFINVPEPHFFKPVSTGNAVRLGWSQLKETFREIRHMKVVGLFLLAYWLYIDGVGTIIRMAVDYGMFLGFPADSLIKALLLVQFVAFPAALATGFIARYTGAKKMILISIAGYGFITVFAFFMRVQEHFYILAVLVGLFQGGVQALSRSLYAQIIPKNKAGQFFGFYNMLGKFAAVIGPALMGTVTIVTGNPRLGILSIMVLFIGGFWLLTKVDVEKGKRVAESRL